MMYICLSGFPQTESRRLIQRINPMRKLLLTTAAVAAAIAVAGCSKKLPQEPVSITYDTLTDERDGQTYRTVKIGEQTWMAQNLNYQTDSSWCYENSIDSCSKYGRLYNWMTSKAVCPKGWMLPSREDWKNLVTTAGGWETAGKRLKSKSGWNDYCGDDDEPQPCVSGNGTNDFGFSALSGGDRGSDGDFYGAGYGGNWWTATEYSSDYAYYRLMDYGYDNAVEDKYYKSDGYSVRCVAAPP